MNGVHPMVAGARFLHARSQCLAFAGEPAIGRASMDCRFAHRGVAWR
jgi:hypothetical protein